MNTTAIKSHAKKANAAARHGDTRPIAERLRLPMELAGGMAADLRDAAPDDDAIKAVDAAYRTAGAAYERFRDAAAVVLSDETQMPLAREAKLAELAQRRLDENARRFADVYDRVAIEIERIDDELAGGDPPRDLMHRHRAQEVRQLYAAKDADGRRAFLAQIAKAGDRGALHALAGERLLSGLSDAEAKGLRTDYLARHHAGDLARREVLETARVRLELAAKAHRSYARAPDPR